jgi:hypothetical protein
MAPPIAATNDDRSPARRSRIGAAVGENGENDRKLPQLGATVSPNYQSGYAGHITTTFEAGS